MTGCSPFPKRRVRPEDTHLFVNEPLATVLECDADLFYQSRKHLVAEKMIGCAAVPSDGCTAGAGRSPEPSEPMPLSPSMY